MSSNELHGKNRKTEIIKNLSKYICLCNQAYVTKTSLFIFVKNLLFIDSGGLQTRVQKKCAIRQRVLRFTFDLCGGLCKRSQ